MHFLVQNLKVYNGVNAKGYVFTSFGVDKIPTLFDKRFWKCPFYLFIKHSKFTRVKNPGLSVVWIQTG
jgi:hypothetical protein